MFIAVLQFELLVHGAMSLKDKRRVVKSVKDRLHREHMVSVAEVAALDHHRLAVMGLALVSNSAPYASSVLDSIIAKLRGLRDAELGAVSREILHGHQLPDGEADDDAHDHACACGHCEDDAEAAPLDAVTLLEREGRAS